MTLTVMNNIKSFTEEEKQLNLIFLKKLMDKCYIDKSTGQFFCNKCKCIVSIDWKNRIAYCVSGGILCICVSQEDIGKKNKD